MGLSTPPSIMERLIGRLVRADQREYLLGDLAESFADLHSRRGRLVATLWYCAQLGPVLTVLVMGDLPSAIRRYLRGVVLIPGEFRVSVRTLARHPGHSLISIAVLAIGIAGAVASFSVVKGVVLDPLDLRDPDRITAFWSPGDWSQAEFDLVRQRTLVHSAVAAYSPFARLAFRNAGDPEMLVASSVTGEFFDVLGSTAHLGRVFSRRDEIPGSPLVAVLSYGLWQSRFGGDSTVVGQAITLDQDQYVVVGVMPAEYWFPARDVELWVSAKIETGTDFYRFSHFYHLLGRLREDATIEQAGRDAQILGSALQAEFNYSENFSKADGAFVIRLKDKVVGNATAFLSVLVGAVAIVMLIAFATVAGLALNRNVGRRTDLAIRVALGADRVRLAAHLLGEGLLLFAAAIATGIGLSVVAVRSLVAILPTNTPRLHEVDLDLTVLLSVAGFSLIAGISLSLMPLMRGSLGVSQGPLRAGMVGAAGREGVRTRRTLIVAETMLSVALVVGAGLLAKSLWILTNIDPGFETENILTFEINPPTDYDGPRRTQLVTELLALLGPLGNGTPAGGVSRLPLRAGWSFGVETPDMIDEDAAATAIPWRAVTPGFFETLGMRAVQGRLFDGGDGPTATQVAIVNRRLAETFWPGANPIGRSIRIRFPGREWMTVVGVVEDSRVVGIREAVPPTLYQPFAQSTRVNVVSFALRTSADPTAVVPALRALVRETDPNVAVGNVETMSGILDAEFLQSKNLFLIVGGFAAFAMLLGALGLFGVVSEAVSTRTREIGIRVALGARPSRVLKGFVAEGIALAGLGVVLGVVVALVLTQTLQQSLYGVGVNDPATIVVVVLLQFAVAVAASIIPAVRASRVDPSIVLRDE